MAWDIKPRKGKWGGKSHHVLTGANYDYAENYHEGRKGSKKVYQISS